MRGIYLSCFKRIKGQATMRLLTLLLLLGSSHGVFTQLPEIMEEEGEEESGKTICYDNIAFK